MGSLFGGAPPPPKPPPVVRMPDPQDPASIEARRRKQAEIAMRSGRASTVLDTTPSQPTGGSGGAPGNSAYGATLLGQS